MVDISYYYTQNNTKGEFVEFLSWFALASLDYPNDKINGDNIDLYYQHMIQCIDRFIKNVRAVVVTKEKINQSWDCFRLGDDRKAVRILQQAQEMVESPDLGLRWDYGDRCENS